MKSRLIRGAAYEEVELPCLEIELTKEDLQSEVERDINQAQLAGRIYTTGVTVQNGSIVEVELVVNRCNESKITRKILINCGAELFDKEAEQQLVGHSIGETVFAYLGEKPIEMRILSIREYRLPEKTDTWVAKLGIPQVHSMEEYRSYLREYYVQFYKENYLIYFAMEFFRNWMTISTWEWDEDEIRELTREYREMQQRYLDAHDTYIDDTEENLETSAREETMESLGYWLASGETGDLHFTDENLIEQIRSKALAPIITFLSDKVVFVGREEA